MDLIGKVETATWRSVKGWICINQSNRSSTVCVFQDGVLVCMGKATSRLPKLDAADEACYGFDLLLPPKIRTSPSPWVEVRNLDGEPLAGSPIALNMQPVGYVDSLTEGKLRGWACDPAQPFAEVELIVGNRTVATVTADSRRGDLEGIVPDGRCAFEIPFDEPHDRFCVRIKGTTIVLPVSETFAAAAPSAPSLRNVPSLHDTARLVAFYLPQFHPIPENDAWWGKNFTEWNNVTRAIPLYETHLQPRLPKEMGFYNILDPEVRNTQFALAREAGIDAFCYYYYWFNGRRLLERPLEDVLYDRVDPFPFCLCWANENWTRRWDGCEEEILIEQVHSLESDIAFFEDIAPYLEKEHYLRYEGRPVLLVYRPTKMVDSEATTAMWREMARQRGIGELHLAAVQSFGFLNPRPFGFDAAVEFPPHFITPHASCKDIRSRFHLDNQFSGNIYDYDTVVDVALKRRPEPYLLHRGLMTAWDNTPRRGRNATIFHGASPRRYGRWLEGLLADTPVDSPSLVFVNAWNEWAEGAILEPSTVFGNGFLQATRAARSRALYTRLRPEAPREIAPLEPVEDEGVILVGHDAHRNGAQMILLSIARALKARGVPAAILLYRGGPMLSKFSDLYETHVITETLADSQRLANLIDSLQCRNLRRVITNTVATGHIVKHFKDAGMQVASLIHELPRLVRQCRLEHEAQAAANFADWLVVPAAFVADHFRSLQYVSPEKIRIIPQGCYTRLAPKDSREDIRKTLRKQLRLAPDARIVLGCGYADFRKGFDLFLAVAAHFAAADPPVHFLWLGDIENELNSRINDDILRVTAAGNCTRVDFQENVEEFYCGSDLFLLTSREDPFPTVLLEAFAAGLPAVGFERAGGFNSHTGTGLMHLVAYLDVCAMGNAVQALLDAPEALAFAAEAGPRYIADNFSVDAYVERLLGLFATASAQAVVPGYDASALPSVSVVVPNYNYGPYLPLRLLSVLHQTVRPTEIIILDDGSTDESLDVIETFAAFCPVPVTVLQAPDNSGNPFLQWENGLRAARGELVWMAEADDYCEPDFLEHLLPCFTDPEVGLAYSHSRPVGQHGETLTFHYNQYLEPISPTLWRHSFKRNGREFVESAMAWRNPIPNASAVVFRRAAIPESAYQAKNFRFFGDWFFYVHCILSGKVAFVAKELNYHRRHPESAIAFVEKSHLYVDELLRIYETLLTLDSLHFSRPNKFMMLHTLYEQSTKRLSGLDESDPVLLDLAARYRAVAQALVERPEAGRPRPTGLRILVVAGDLTVGGGQLAAVRLANALCEDNRVYLLDARPHFPSKEKDLRIDPRVRLVEESPRNLAITRQSHALSESPARLEALAAFIAAENIDLVNSHLWWADRLVAQLRERLPFTWVTSLHGCYEFLTSQPEVDPDFRALVYTIFRLANGVTCAATKNLAGLEQAGKNLFMEISQVNLGYDRPQHVRSAPADPRLTFALVARGIPEKGWELTIAAADAMEAAYPGQCRVMLIGGSDYVEQLEAEHGDKDWIVFHGYQKDPAPFIQEADIGILSSYFGSESQPLTIMEYFHFGKPIIATDIGEIRAMVAGGGLVAGQLLQLGDNPKELVPQLVQAMTRYLVDPELRAIHARNAKIRAESLFSITTYRDNFLTVFQRAMDQALFDRSRPMPGLYEQFRLREHFDARHSPRFALSLRHPDLGVFLDCSFGADAETEAATPGIPVVEYDQASGLVTLLGIGWREIAVHTSPFRLELAQRITISLARVEPQEVPCEACLTLVSANTEQALAPGGPRRFAASPWVPLAQAGETMVPLAVPPVTEDCALLLTLRVAQAHTVVPVRITGLWLL